MATAEKVKRKRRTYSIDPDRASDLGRCQISIGDELDANVNRQDILDELVLLMSTDKSVYQKVVKAIKSRS
jgi:hypothetical protein